MNDYTQWTLEQLGAECDRRELDVTGSAADGVPTEKDYIDALTADDDSGFSAGDSEFNALVKAVRAHAQVMSGRVERAGVPWASLHVVLDGKEYMIMAMPTDMPPVG
jgi:hypothetical protein